MRTHVHAWGNPDKPDLDILYTQGVTDEVHAYLMQTYPYLQIACLEVISAEALLAALQEH